MAPASGTSRKGRGKRPKPSRTGPSTSQFLQKNWIVLYGGVVALAGIAGGLLYTQAGEVAADVDVGVRTFESSAGRSPPLLSPFPGETPLSALESDHNETLFWGTYKAGLYYGIKSRSFPAALTSGLMWHSSAKGKRAEMRHECLENDQMKTYTWTEHDGVSFGRQRVLDRKHAMIVETEFIKPEQDPQTWTATATFTGPKGDPKGSQKKKHRKVSAYVYMGLDCDGAAESASACLDLAAGDGGESASFSSREVKSDSGPSTIAFRASAGLGIGSRRGGLVAFGQGVSVSVKALSLASLAGIKDIAKDFNKIETKPGKPTNVALVKIKGRLPLKIMWKLAPADSKLGLLEDKVQASAEVRAEVQRRARQFDERFEATFGLKAKGFVEHEVKFAKACLSNMLGGMGYFYGASDVKLPPEYYGGGSESNQLEESYNMPLFSAVPSRSFFPRGFLWDEGFHQLLISKWNVDITKDVLGHWMSAVRKGGWIPREQILGDAARRRVPDRFVTQVADVANPPTLIFLVEKLLDSANNEQAKDSLAFLSKLYPRLSSWCDWLLESQSGPVAGSFRWRGREASEDVLHPNTLASGLDDYPRATHPDENESHVDMLSWAIAITRSMAKLARAVAPGDEDAERYEALSQQLSASLDSLHWDEESGAYCDKGMHSEGGAIETRYVFRCSKEDDSSTKDIGISREALESRQNPCPPNFPKPLYPFGDGKGGLLTRDVFVAGEDVSLSFVRQKGYVSLFPLLLKILPADSPRLGAVLELLRDEQELWTPYGLRSLGKSSRFYEVGNAPGDRPYWRGAIWMPINYLAVAALFHYKNTPGPLQSKAGELYKELRLNLIKNVHDEYQRTGYIWEQYNDKTGEGQRSHPFTGWTALIVSIMAEQF